MDEQKPSRKELELEKQLWEERSAGIKNGLQALTFQGQLLQLKLQECDREAQRCADELKAMESAA